MSSSLKRNLLRSPRMVAVLRTGPRETQQAQPEPGNTMKTLAKKILAACLAASAALLALDARASFIELYRTNYFQNFDTLNISGKSHFLPAGWSIASQDNAVYADDGSAKQANIYSYGVGTSGNRALGALTSGGNDPIFGASFQNASPNAIATLNISYTGEEWRLGQAGVANT